MQTFLFYKDNSLVYDLSFENFSTGEVERDKKLRKESYNNTNDYYYYCSIITKRAHSSYFLYHFNYGIQQFNTF